jgi:hypothetical protein
LKPEPVPVLNLCVLDLPVQFAKDKSARVMPLVKLRSGTRSGQSSCSLWALCFSVRGKISWRRPALGPPSPCGAKPCLFHTRRGRRVSISLREKRP